MADIFVAAGDVKTGEKVRLGKKIVRKITVSIVKIQSQTRMGLLLKFKTFLFSCCKGSTILNTRLCLK